MDSLMKHVLHDFGGLWPSFGRLDAEWEVLYQGGLKTYEGIRLEGHIFTFLAYLIKSRSGVE